MIDIRKLCKGSGYLIVDSPHDTTNIVCRFGHVYADGNSLVAALQNGTRQQCLALRKLGTMVMDGDFGELSVRFPPAKLRDVVRILKPRQTEIAKVAA